MNEHEIKTLLESLFGQFMWVAAIYLSVSIFKGIILNVYEGLMVFIGNDFNADDVVYIGTDERPARIVRMGLRKTVFYMKDTFGDWSVKMIVPNERLKTMVIKKSLPKNGNKLHTVKGDD